MIIIDVYSDFSTILPYGNFRGISCFKSLSDNLGKIFDKLTGVGYLTEDHINKALREIRVTLLGADVALPVVKHFMERIKEEAVGEKVVKSVTPGQLVVKIVQDKLEEILSIGDHFS